VVISLHFKSSISEIVHDLVVFRFYNGIDLVHTLLLGLINVGQVLFNLLEWVLLCNRLMFILHSNESYFFQSSFDIFKYALKVAKSQSEIGNWLLDNLKVFNGLFVILYLKVIIIFPFILFLILFTIKTSKLHFWGTRFALLLLFLRKVLALLSSFVIICRCYRILRFFNHSLIPLLAPHLHLMC